MTASVQALLAAVERIPGVELEIDDARTSAAVRVGAQVVARIDLWHGHVVVNAPADVIPTLQGVFPSSTRAATGIAFDLDHAQARSEALPAIRRRVDVERVVAQYREASP
jgi:hypothetical protein